MAEKTILIDDRELAVPALSEICTFCVHWIVSGSGKSCTAFPNGIPMVIWMGKDNHKKRYPGDQGIIFKKREV